MDIDMETGIGMDIVDMGIFMGICMFIGVGVPMFAKGVYNVELLLFILLRWLLVFNND
jgi:hypothetical protein